MIPKVTKLKHIWIKPSISLHWLTILISITIFTIILLPRVLPFPHTFLTFDEITIGRWSAEMGQAFLAADWPDTANNAYPAVTLMWVDLLQAELIQLIPGQSFTSTQMLSNVNEDIFASLPRRRLTLALLNTIIVFVIFWLLRKLYNNFVAVIAAIFMAFDPFLLTQSRVFRTEGLTTSLMVASALTIIIYVKERKDRWLIGSAILGGLATLTKITSLFLLAYVGLTLLVWFLFANKQGMAAFIRQFGRDLLMWSAIFALTFVILWPALWVAPAATFGQLFDYLGRATTDSNTTWGEGGFFFFRGEIRADDPGILYYLWSLAYRTTPFVWGGIIALLLAVVKPFLPILQRLKQHTPNSNHQPLTTWLILAYVIFYFIALSLGASKVDRYLLPIFPGLSILAAVGFWEIIRFFPTDFISFQRQQWGSWGILLLGSVWLAFPHHPYYFDYWNPLLGGSQTAIEILPVGSGEGIDTLLTYLNDSPIASNLSLTGTGTIILQNCQLTFKGTCLEETEFLASDYFMTYIFDLQRRPGRHSVIDAVVSQAELDREYINDDVVYARLYKMPAHLYSTNHWLSTHGRLLGYRLSAVEVQAGETINITIFWENGETQGWQFHDSEFFVKLLDKTGQTYEIVSAQLNEQFQAYQSQPNEILLFDAPFQIPLDINIGLYSIEIGLRLKTTGEETWKFPLQSATDIITINQGIQGVSPETLSLQHALQQPLGNTGITLVGYNVFIDPELPRFDLYWRREETISVENYIVQLALHNRQGQTVARWQKLLTSQLHPLSDWKPDEIVKLSVPLVLGHQLPNDIYQPLLSLLPNMQQTAQPLATLQLAVLPDDFILQPPILNIQHRFEQAMFGETLDLLGYNLEGNQYSGNLFVTLYWLNRDPTQAIETSVQLLDQNQNVITEQTLSIPQPEISNPWYSFNHYDFSLSTRPSSLNIRVRQVDTQQWYQVRLPNDVIAEQIFIDDILNKTVPIN